MKKLYWFLEVPDVFGEVVHEEYPEALVGVLVVLEEFPDVF